MNIEEINAEIKKWEYTPFTIRTEKANYYKLEDGAIIRVLPVLTALKFDESQPEFADAGMQNVLTVFVPPHMRGPPSNEVRTVAQMKENIAIPDMNFETLIENFNVYEVDNKWVLSVKITVSQVSKTKLFNNAGEPIYLIGTAPIPKMKPK